MREDTKGNGDELNMRNTNIEKEIEDYVYSLLLRYDMSPDRVKKNDEIKDKIVRRCKQKLEEYEDLSSMFDDNSQIHYFVKQTILYGWLYIN